MATNTLQQEKIINEYKCIEKEKTREILRATAEKINIQQIKTALLLMAFNLDDLEELNKKDFENEKILNN